MLFWSSTTPACLNELEPRQTTYVLVDNLSQLPCLTIAGLPLILLGMTLRSTNLG